MDVRGPEGRNSFVLLSGGAGDDSQPTPTERKLDRQTYARELCKVLLLLLAIAGIILLPIFMIWKWGWAIIVIPK